jgi:hypothetical protein
VIGLAADIRPFFARVNPNAAEFTPHFNKIRDWDSGLFCLHHYLPLKLRLTDQRGFFLHAGSFKDRNGFDPALRTIEVMM